MGTLLSRLFPATRLRLLVLFYRQPKRRLHLREVIRLTGTGQGTVQRELGNLVEAGVLAREREHGRVFFAASPASPIYGELASMVRKAFGVGATLSKALAGLEGIRAAFIFGSLARGTEHAESDVDLLVIGEASFRRVVAAVSGLHEDLGREINPVVLSPAEFGERRAAGDPFLTEVLAMPVEFVIGSADDLRALAGE